MRFRWSWSFALALWVALAPHPARGEEDASREAKQEARALANEGYRLFKQGNYQRAVEAFTAADRRFHAPTILFMLGQSYERMGRLVEASETYQAVVDEDLGRRAPREFVEAQKRAAARLDALEGRIPSLRVRVTGAPAGEAQITIDGLAVVPPPKGGPLPQNPGQHTVGAVATGFHPVTRVVTLAEGEQQDVTLQLIPVDPLPAAEAEPEGLPEQPADAASPPPEGGGVPTASIVALTIGAVGLGLGAATGVITLTRANELESICRPPRCEGSSPEELSEAKDLHDRASTLALVSNISFIAGGVATLAGLGFLALRPSPTSGPAQVGLRVGPGWLGVEGAF